MLEPFGHLSIRNGNVLQEVPSLPEELVRYFLNNQKR